VDHQTGSCSTVAPATAVTTRDRVHGWGTRLGVAAFVAVAWLIAAARAVPYRDGDRGVFASVAERLVAGDRLYVDVWDNKEPLFYLTLSFGRVVSPLMDVVLELLWLLAGSYAAFVIARTYRASIPTSILVGFTITPLVLTGSSYYAGFTHLPGTVLLLASLALLVRGHLFAAGLLLPVIAGFKILALPVALALLITYALIHRSLPWLRYILGAALSLGALALLLALRGELVGFLTLVQTNIAYSQSDLADVYNVPIWSHLEPVLQGPTVALLATTLLILAITRVHLTSESRDLWWTAVATLIAGLLVVAGTGLWSHHAQIFFISGVLAAVLLTTALPTFQSFNFTGAVGLAAVAVLLSGVPSLRDTADEVLSAPTRFADLSRTADATVSLQSIAPAGSTYARLGKNTEDSHAQGLRDLELVCYQFLQYPYDPPENLARIPECLPTADFVIVDPTFAIEPGQDKWNEFIDKSATILRRDFDCQSEPWGELCVNRTLTN